MSKKSKHTTPFHSAEAEDAMCKANNIRNQSEYKLALQDESFLLRSEVRPLRIQMELMRPELVLTDHNIHETMIFFGSARIPETEEAKKKLRSAEEGLKNNSTNPEYIKLVRRAENVLKHSAYLKEAELLATMISKESEWTVVTGGGPSFMRAANKGAFDSGQASIALGVALPHEQTPNEFVTPELTFQFHYFAIRKMHFLMRARAVAAFPGGFGTLDELFETLTLIQTEKIDRLPLVLFGEDFWRHVVNFEALADAGMIDHNDIQLIHYVETADEAWKYITQFYKK